VSTIDRDRLRQVIRVHVDHLLDDPGGRDIDVETDDLTDAVMLALATPARPPEGWARPQFAKRFHYFRDGKSLCREHTIPGATPLLPDNPAANMGVVAGPNDCMSCSRVLRPRQPRRPRTVKR
jgi:hypothetical protein